MTHTEHKFALDVTRTASQVSISVKKRDTARRLLIHLVERGLPYHIGKDCYAVFTARKPDGKVVFNNCSIEECVILYDLTEQTVAAVGLMECEIILYGTGGKQLTSASFEIIVEDTIYDTETEVESTNEYNALADLIQKTQKLLLHGQAARAIVQEVYGSVISVTDASNQALQGMRIFGKSAQDGTPTPDNPVEVVSLKPVVTITDGTDVQMLGLDYNFPGLRVTSGGNYTDASGQQWVCDEIDLRRGVYVQRIGAAVLAGNSRDNYTLAATFGEILRFDVKGVSTYARSDIVLCSHLPLGAVGSTAEICNIHGLIGYPIIQIRSSRLESADAGGLAEYLAENPMTIYYVLRTPIETALSSELIANFDRLHTYKPSTNITNDAGAYMAVEYVADTKIYIDNKGGSTTACRDAGLVDATVE